MARSSKAASVESLQAAVSEALALLPAEPRIRPSADEQLPSLLAQCEALTAQIAAPQPVRLVHHFACSGGTILSRCIAALPNTVVLSEIDPLSTYAIYRRHALGLQMRDPFRRFSPSDLITGLRNSARPVPDRLLIDVFLDGLRGLVRNMTEIGLHLVLRDHPHSLFCSDVNPADRPSLREMVSSVLPTRSLVTVRNPVDSFLSLQEKDWPKFSPFTLTEYCRRYHLFLDRHANLPITRYEDVIANPRAALQRMTEDLDLPFNAAALDLVTLFPLSGDSGRSSKEIAPRPRRAISKAVLEELATSSSYHSLAERLDYPLVTG